MTTETLSAEIALTRILIIDDHTTFAELLAGALDREPDLAGVGCAATAQAGVVQFLETTPDVVVLDYHLPDGDGLGVAEQILAMSASTRVVMLTGDPTPGVLERAAALGVCAFLPKDGSLATMLDTLRHARRGSMVVHPSLLAQLGARRASTGGVPVPTLTQRELEVLRLMATGKDVRGNAKALGISLNTCRGYVKSILAKLGAHSQLEAVVTATHMGLLAGR